MRIAVVGGGVSGLVAAYEMEKARKAGADIDWQLFEASERLGGVLRTTSEQGFVLEGGPDAWVSEKTAARELAVELGLEDELIFSQDATRKTYILRNGALQTLPDHMRMMVPTDLSALEGSSLFSSTAKQAFAAEIDRAEELKRSAPAQDESVANFVERHFGPEALETVAAPLLSGVFGGDVHKLSVRAVMAPFVAMEREHGSLIVGLREKSKARGDKPAVPVFTSLRSGMQTMMNAIIATLQPDRLHLNAAAEGIAQDTIWTLRTRARNSAADAEFDHLVLATPLTETRRLLERDVDTSLLPVEASSAVLVAFAWHETFDLPPGFGFLVAEHEASELLACTFVDQKFSHRAPQGGRVIRVFFGGKTAEALLSATDDIIITKALEQLRSIVGNLPQPSLSHVSRWPRSLPQYEVGHLDRIAGFERALAATPTLHVLGNCLRGVGIPDLVQHSRECVRGLLNFEHEPR